MKRYSPRILENWADDAGKSDLLRSELTDQMFGDFHELAVKSLEELVLSVKTIKQQDNEDIYDRLYRRAHVLLGFAEILQLPKATHLFAVLDFAFDLARENESFENYSLDYLIKLLGQTARDVLDDFFSGGRSERQLTEVIEECRLYLTRALEESDSAKRPTSNDVKATPRLPEEGASEPTTSKPELAVEENAFASSTGLGTEESQEVDDGPEVLDIPTNKIGLVSDFCDECRESLQHIGHALVELEDSANPSEIVNNLFRSVHTLKGGARMLKIRKMEIVTHRLESLLDQVRAGTRRVTTDLVDVLLEGRRLVEEMVEEVASHGPIRTRIQPAMDAISAIEDERRVVGAPRAHETRPAAPGRKVDAESDEMLRAEDASGPTQLTGKRFAPAESIRVPTEKLDDVLNTASEIFISRIRLKNDVTAIGTALERFHETLQRNGGARHGSSSYYSGAYDRLLDDLNNALHRSSGRLDYGALKPVIKRFEEDAFMRSDVSNATEHDEIALNVLSIDEMRKRLQKNVEHLEQLSSRLQTGAMSFRMVPISSLFERFPMQLRDLARQVGKKVKLEISGADTELDKVLINQLADPLMHILRNAVDHGIESADERVKRGKEEIGQIILRAFYHGSHAVIEVADDGKGIDVADVLAKAIDRGLVDNDASEKLTKQEILDLIFEPGFSTAREVSALSGRGVGMDVVKTAVSQIQGSVTLESTPGAGTRITMRLPLTLAVVGVLLVEERSNRFAFPILQVDEIVSVPKEDIKTINGESVYNYRGRTLPVTSLSSVLDFPASRFSADELSLVIVSAADKRIAVVVDSVLGRQEVLIRNLGKRIKKVPFVMGCTILSDSRLVLILNSWEIVNVRNQKSHGMLFDDTRGLVDTVGVRSVLVVDDSALQRSYLKSILEHAGYAVETVENGFEALKSVRGKSLSAICVDVSMPIMDGFEFLERLRQIPRHAETPVFFVTVRASKNDRLRALRLGVKEYFIKPIDTNELLNALDRHCADEAPGNSASGSKVDAGTEASTAPR